VFVVEQRCPYQEADYKDEHSLHVMGWQDNELVAYARIVAPGISYKEVSLGRVATVYALRGVGIGKLLMKETMRMILEHYGDVPVRISAQSYLQRFYESFGFACIGQEYQEDDIPHIEMLRRPLLGA
jgi:ElaA protein